MFVYDYLIRILLVIYNLSIIYLYIYKSICLSIHLYIRIHCISFYLSIYLYLSSFFSFLLLLWFVTDLSIHNIFREFWRGSVECQTETSHFAPLWVRLVTRMLMLSNLQRIQSGAFCLYFGQYRLELTSSNNANSMPCASTPLPYYSLRAHFSSV